MMLSWIVSLAAHIQFRRSLQSRRSVSLSVIATQGVTTDQAHAIPARSPLGKWGSIIGLIVVLASIGKTWFDSRVNLIAGVTLLLGLTVAYAAIKPSRPRSS
jgi:purine-cytosine permease-like protein